MAYPGDGLVDLAAGQFTALAGLRALNNLDLQFIRVCQVPDGDTEPAGRDLLDGGTLGVTIFHGLKANRVFPAFAGIGLAANPVHGNGQRLVTFRRD